jgi:hypothetical protein
MRNNPINIHVPLYRGVSQRGKYMPNKGNYNSNRIVSFSKNLNMAKSFAMNGGTVYILPPGRYTAFNVNANVKNRHPNWLNFTRKITNMTKRFKNYIGHARSQGEVIFAPGIFTVGNVRKNMPNNGKYKNITYVRK